MLTSILRLPQERTTAKGLFVTADDRETALTTSIASSVSTRAAKPILTIDEPKAVMTGKAGRLLSKEEQDRVKAAIAKATSMEEVRRLERALKEGYVPDLDSVGA
jgi:U2 small nuclear ribonucleoprotein A'